MKIPSTILIFATHGLQSALYVSAAISSLRRAFPDSQIDLIVNPITAPVFRYNDQIRHLIQTEGTLQQAEAIYMRNRYGRYDLTINTESTIFPAWLVGYLGKTHLGTLGGNRWLSLLVRLRWPFSTHWITEAPQPEHPMLRLQRLLNQIGVTLDPKITLPEARLPHAIKQSLPQRYIVLHPGDISVLKQWPTIHWVRTIQLLQLERYFVVLTSHGPQELQQVKLIMEQLPSKNNVLNLANHLSLPQFNYLVKYSLGIICQDSLYAQLASAYPISIVCILSHNLAAAAAPWPYELSPQQVLEQPIFNQPLREQEHKNVILLQAQLSCVPCMQTSCYKVEKDTDTPPCLPEIFPSHVVNSIQRLVQKKF